MKPTSTKRLLIVLAVALAAGGAWYWQAGRDKGFGPGFASGNGRIEATDVDVATKQAGRVRDILVDEGAFVKAGQPLATMDVESLDAQRAEAQARLQQAETGVAAAESQVAMRESDLDAAQRRARRSEGRAPAWETTVAEQRRANIHLHEGVDEAGFVAMRQARDATLAMPVLILPAIQVNIRAGALPPAEANGVRYLKIPVDVL